jgi:hypothetical protein
VVLDDADSLRRVDAVEKLAQVAADHDVGVHEQRQA